MRKAIVEKELSHSIVGCFYEVYNALGYGFLESVYSKSMEVALGRRGLKAKREVPVAVHFLGVEVGKYRIDMLIEDRVILEIKASERLSDVPILQLRNYLSATGIELGIVLQFGPRAEFRRVLNPTPKKALLYSGNSGHSGYSGYSGA